MTIGARKAAKILAGCLFAIAVVLSTTALTSANGSAQAPQQCGTQASSSSPPAASANPVELCETVSYSGNSGVSPGASAPFTIMVSSSGGTASNAVVTLTAKVGSSAVTPQFTPCPGTPGTDSNHEPTCTISSLSSGQTQNLPAAVNVPSSAANEQSVTLTATTTSQTPAINVPADSASTSVVTSTPTRSGGGVRPVSRGGGGTVTGSTTGGSPSGPTGSNGSTGPSGSAPGGGAAAGAPNPATFAAGTGNPLAYTAGPLRKFLPVINGGSPKTPGSISAQLPSIPPTVTDPTAGPASYHGTASGPLSRKMLGTQLLGLAALCAALGIVLVRFWRRKAHAAAAAAARPGDAAAAGPAIVGPAAALPAAAGPVAAAGQDGRLSGWRRLLRGRTASPS